jgi:hypothetical protein
MSHMCIRWNSKMTSDGDSGTRAMYGAIVAVKVYWGGTQPALLENTAGLTPQVDIQVCSFQQRRSRLLHESDTWKRS